MAETKSENVAVLGASDRPDRFAYRADKLLREHGHTTFLVNPNLTTIEGREVRPNLPSLQGTKIDTLTLYVNPKILAQQIGDVIAMKPKRVIFNPGTESQELEAKLSAAGIEPVHGCTLVMLNTNTY